jgi:predicted dehydrogenase
MTESLRVAVIGAGAIAQVAHFGVLKRLEGIELAALSDIDVSKARALAKRFGIPDVYDDIEDLLTYARPDAVAICTPNHLHKVHALTALSAGVHVFCERPLALASSGVREVIEAQQRADRVVAVGMNYRFRSDVQALLEFLHSGELGGLRVIRTGWHIWRPSSQLGGWRERPAQSGGGAMMDLGLPLVDLALWVAGRPQPKTVTGWFAKPREDAVVEDTASALIQCEAGLSVLVDVSWRHLGQSERFWFEVMGADGSGAIGPLKVFKEIHRTPMNVTPQETHRWEDALSHSYRAEWTHFLAMVRGEEEPPGLDDQIVLHRTMEAIARSASEGRSVEL